MVILSLRFLLKVGTYRLKDASSSSPESLEPSQSCFSFSLSRESESGFMGFYEGGMSCCQVSKIHKHTKTKTQIHEYKNTLKKYTNTRLSGSQINFSSLTPPNPPTYSVFRIKEDLTALIFAILTKYGLVW